MADTPGPIEGELAEARDLVLLAEPEQLALLQDEQAGRSAGAAVIEAERRGRGRPTGARNKRNAKFRDQILALGPHPAIALQRAYSTPVDLLAAQLGCSRLEAAQLGIRAAAELLPYVEGKQPVTVDLRQRHDVVMIMAGGAGVGGEQLDAIAEAVNLADDELGGIDWGSATIEDLPSLSGEPQEDVRSGEAD
jgi:RNA 3'-terminal phosphate cyclase